MKYLLLLAFIVALGCTKNETTNKITKEYATELAQKILIIDGHVDVPYRLREKYEDIYPQFVVLFAPGVSFVCEKRGAGTKPSRGGRRQSAGLGISPIQIS